MACKFLFLLFIALLLGSPSYSSYSSSAATSPHHMTSNPVPSHDKVNLSLYYEALCPYCADFIVNGLVQAVNTDLINILNLRLVPWGNAKLIKPETIICQHGEGECYLNTVHACAINIWTDLKKHFPFIQCVESKASEGYSQEWKTCAKQLKLEDIQVLNCLESGYGKKLELQYGKETDMLNPPHEYVPWVVVNGKPLYEDYTNFVAHVCKSYKGKPLPSACKSSKPMPKSHQAQAILNTTPIN